MIEANIVGDVLDGLFIAIFGLALAFAFAAPAIAIYTVWKEEHHDNKEHGWHR